MRAPGLAAAGRGHGADRAHQGAGGAAGVSRHPDPGRSAQLLQARLQDGQGPGGGQPGRQVPPGAAGVGTAPGLFWRPPVEAPEQRRVRVRSGPGGCLRRTLPGQGKEAPALAGAVFHAGAGGGGVADREGAQKL